MKNEISLRKDVASNKMFSKNEMIRIVKNKDGWVFIDNTKKAHGRGAYIKPSFEAVEKIKKTRVLERQLKIKIDESFYNLLLNEVRLNWI